MKKILPFLLMLPLISTISYTSARVIKQYTFSQNVYMDTVDVQLNEYMHDEKGNTVPFKYDGTVVPLQKIEKMTLVENKGAECYIRVKMAIVQDKQEVRELTSEEMINLNDQFILHDDGYYYLEHSLKENESIVFIEGVLMPEKELHEYLEDDIESIVFETKLEAIQKRNFDQDLNSNDPWQGVAVQKCIISRMDGDAE